MHTEIAKLETFAKFGILELKNSEKEYCKSSILVFISKLMDSLAILCRSGWINILKFMSRGMLNTRII